ncbi:hypothetical protein, partial [Salmonella sp. SAL04286]|uniref:hypothetical protein n=1 Tax=Salmonella sp. SAL04286 TaxID=3159864 RepID=UPI003978ECD8
PIHVLELRSNWWQPFSDGLFTYGGLTAIIDTALILLPLALLVFALSNQLAIQSRLGRLALSLAFLGVMTQVFAHAYP